MSNKALTNYSYLMESKLTLLKEKIFWYYLIRKGLSAADLENIYNIRFSIILAQVSRLLHETARFKHVPHETFDNPYILNQLFVFFFKVEVPEKSQSPCSFHKWKLSFVVLFLHWFSVVEVSCGCLMPTRKNLWFVTKCQTAENKV